MRRRRSRSYTQSDMHRFPTALLCALLFASSANLRAQSEAGSGTISGSVEDPSGNRVSGAAVRIVNDGTGQIRDVLTSDSGLYSAQRLPPGDYSLSAQKSGFKTVRREHIALGVGSTVVLDFKLELGSTAESVTVSEEAPLIDAGGAATATLVNARSGTSWTSDSCPWSSPRPCAHRRLVFRATARSGRQSRTDANSSYWGQSTGRAGFRDPYAFGQDSVQEFQVLTNSFAAEIGRARQSSRCCSGGSVEQYVCEIRGG
jgi:hypothetical protein